MKKLILLLTIALMVGITSAEAVLTSSGGWNPYAGGMPPTANPIPKTCNNIYLGLNCGKPTYTTEPPVSEREYYQKVDSKYMPII